VVGREGAAKIDALDALVDCAEGQSLEPPETGRQECDVGNEVDAQRQAFRGAVPQAWRHERPDARDVEIDRLTEQEGKEEPRLVPRGPSGQTAPSAGLIGVPNQDTGTHVGVPVEIVGMGMVGIVLSRPPSIAQPPARLPTSRPRSRLRAMFLVTCR